MSGYGFCVIYDMFYLLLLYAEGKHHLESMENQRKFNQFNIVIIQYDLIITEK